MGARRRLNFMDRSVVPDCALTHATTCSLAHHPRSSTRHSIPTVRSRSLRRSAPTWTSARPEPAIPAPRRRCCGTHQPSSGGAFSPSTRLLLALRVARINASGADVLNLLGQGVPAEVPAEGRGWITGGAGAGPTWRGRRGDYRRRNARRAGMDGDRELADLLRSRAAGLDRGSRAYPPIWSCSLRSWTATPVVVSAAI